jgi:hypothetical protein
MTGYKEAYPGIVALIQTAGDRLTWNPHIHIIATVGCLAQDRRYYRAGYLPYDIFCFATFFEFVRSGRIEYCEC